MTTHKTKTHTNTFIQQHPQQTKQKNNKTQTLKTITNTLKHNQNTKQWWSQAHTNTKHDTDTHTTINTNNKHKQYTQQTPLNTTNTYIHKTNQHLPAMQTQHIVNNNMDKIINVYIFILKHPNKTIQNKHTHTQLTKHTQCINNITSINCMYY